MERVTGIGGIFFKARRPARLTSWYQEHLGLPATPCGVSVTFTWREGPGRGRKAETVWSPFPTTTDYFGSSRAPFMINYRVRNLDAMLAQLRQAKVKIEPVIEDSEFGRFAWVTDPEGNRVELWEPPRPARPRKAAKAARPAAKAGKAAKVATKAARPAAKAARPAAKAGKAAKAAAKRPR
jgi:catechol 2,3-dioxygenase-like lactoylglutathione lyase family enzyme